MTAAVSVIVPCFNGEATLPATVASALSQDTDLEVIVVDDGSTDGSLAIARAFEPKVRVLTGPNQGASAARNRGVEIAAGEWFIFLDADDLLAPGTVAQRLALARASDVDAVVCDWRETIGEAEADAASPVLSVDAAALDDDAELAILGGLWAPPAALMYARALVERIGRFRSNLPVIQDARYLFDAAQAGARFGRSAHVGALYRVAPKSLSRRSPAKFWLDVLANAEEIEALWRDADALTPARKAGLGRAYDTAARGLFAAGHEGYFAAVGRLAALGEPLALHPRLVRPLARTLGLAATARLVGLFGR